MIIQQDNKSLDANTFIGVYENIVNQDDCNLIIEYFEKQLQENIENKDRGDYQFKEDKMGRHDYHVYLKSSDIKNPVVKIINDALDKSVSKYAEEFWIIKQLKNATSLNIKLQKTPPRGGYHVWHCEQQENNSANRVLVWTLYLNDIKEGEGETEFLWQGIKVKAKEGSVCLFPASFTHTHRGNSVYSQNKYIATGWYTLEP